MKFAAFPTNVTVQRSDWLVGLTVSLMVVVDVYQRKMNANPKLQRLEPPKPQPPYPEAANLLEGSPDTSPSTWTSSFRTCPTALVRSPRLTGFRVWGLGLKRPTGPYMERPSKRPKRSELKLLHELRPQKTAERACSSCVRGSCLRLASDRGLRWNRGSECLPSAPRELGHCQS